MESFFDATGAAGRTMMRSTAAIQVNLDLGAPDDTERRWRLTHARRTGARRGVRELTVLRRPAERLAVHPPRGVERDRPRAHDAGCERCRRSDARGRATRSTPTSCSCGATAIDHLAIPPGFTFADWIEHGHPEGWPTPDDLEYHLTTLFPPVRPRGWFELRMVDALPEPVVARRRGNERGARERPRGRRVCAPRHRPADRRDRKRRVGDSRAPWSRSSIARGRGAAVLRRRARRAPSQRGRPRDHRRGRASSSTVSSCAAGVPPTTSSTPFTATAHCSPAPRSRDHFDEPHHQPDHHRGRGGRRTHTRPHARPRTCSRRSPRRISTARFPN